MRTKYSWMKLTEFRNLLNSNPPMDPELLKECELRFQFLEDAIRRYR